MKTKQFTTLIETIEKKKYVTLDRHNQCEIRIKCKTRQNTINVIWELKKYKARELDMKRKNANSFIREKWGEM